MSHRSPQWVAVALILCFLVAPTARAAQNLYAPYVAFGAHDRADLELRDRSGRGALVRIHLHDEDGARVSLRGHPITISRAVPPGETIDVALHEFIGRAFVGSLQLSSNAVVDAHLATAITSYELMGKIDRGGEIPAIGSEVPGTLFVALQNAGDARVTVIVESGEEGETRNAAEVQIPARGNRLTTLPRWARTVPLRTTGSGPVAGLFLAGTPKRLQPVAGLR